MFSPSNPLYDWYGLNQEIFVQLNRGGGPLWDWAALAGSFLGDHRWYAVYVALALTAALRRPARLAPRRVLVFAWGYLLTWAAIAWLKPRFDFPRPLAVLGPKLVHVLGHPELHHGFPSGHTAFVFLMAGSLAPGAPPALRYGLVLFALWVTWSRIATGAHFPADVLGGALLGLAAAALATLWVRLILPAPQSPPPLRFL